MNNEGRDERSGSPPRQTQDDSVNEYHEQLGEVVLKMNKAPNPRRQKNRTHSPSFEFNQPLNRNPRKNNSSNRGAATINAIQNSG